MSLAAQIIDLLHNRQQKIAVAESVTGGLISAALTAVPGASAVFLGGIVAYDENVKIHALGVDREEIHSTHGYSEKTARQMADRVRRRNAADISIATTGCAGPDFVQGFENGRVLFALAQKGKETHIFDERFSGNRDAVRAQAVEFALMKILAAIQA